MRSRDKGFSLIELIIVIAIMAVLVAIIAPNLSKYLGSSKKRTDNMNAQTIKSVIEHACALTSTEVDLPTVTDTWVEIDSGSAYYDTNAVSGKNGYTAFAKYVADELHDVPVVKETKNHFWVYITVGSDNSFKVQVQAR